MDGHIARKQKIRMPNPFNASYISPALLVDRDILRELLLLRFNDQGIFIKLPGDTGLVSVRVLCCLDDELLIEGLREDPLDCGVAERGVVSGDGGGSESGEEDLHFWIGVIVISEWFGRRMRLLSASDGSDF